jgi:demethylmenaquinone methyltransferase/2-methoxy-6-polyprenyl-1,4-benzoquinol methylase
MAGVTSPTPGQPERRAVRAMFDRIAPRYDLLNRLLSAGIDRRWRRSCVDELGFQVPSRVLDVCTGTADLMLEFLRRDPEHRATGVDLSVEMMRRGARKLAEVGMGGRARLAGADAERLPFADQSFDGAMVAFGIRNVGDPERALREIRRVLRVGARLVVLEFAMPTGALGALYRLYFGRILPRVGGLVSGNAGAYRYLPDSVERFPDPPAFVALMEKAGLARLRFRPLTRGIAYIYRGERAAER